MVEGGQAAQLDARIDAVIDPELTFVVRISSESFGRVEGSAKRGIGTATGKPGDACIGQEKLVEIAKTAVRQERIRAMARVPMKPAYLTNRLGIGFVEVPEGGRVELVGKTIFDSRYFLTFRASGRSIDGQNVRSAEEPNFHLKRCFSVETKSYCVVIYPIEHEAEQFETALIVLRIVSDKFLETISDDELKSIAVYSLRAVSDGELSSDTVTRMLGQFSEMDL